MNIIHYKTNKINKAMSKTDKNNPNEEVEEKNPVLTFDDTKESPVIYGNDLQIPAFIRRQHD